MSDMADIIRDAVEWTPYWTDDPATHQDPYQNAAAALSAAGFGPVQAAQKAAWERCIDHVLVSCTYVTATAELWRHKRLVSDLNEVKAANPYQEDT